MMTGSWRVSGREPGQHPVDDRQVGRALLELEIAFIAARRRVDLVAFGFEVVAQQQGQRFLILDDQYAGCHSNPVDCEIDVTR
jgi:hypothetical protein